MTLEMAFQIAMALVSAFAGILFRHMFNEIKELRKSQANYQLREDARESESRFMEILKEIKQQLQIIDNKLDRKADK
ncbi:MULTISPECIES: hypothetical protein [Providencia]|uniref:hypothetical protein n=1 Tax=Providencia TaxID=586 RepID=UPI001F045CE2|nr:hypothetical protein [Providencia rettgeri]MCG9951260.1 hypothetical protein [Providencia rettgeri]MCG9951648.1 hypothetical protein [Providencia rettgeri]